MSFHPSVSGCGRFLALSYSHDCCISITCFGLKHAESVFVDESCSHCGSMTITALRSRLHYIKHGGVHLAMHRSSASSSKKGRNTSASAQASLSVTVKASPLRKFPLVPCSSSTSQPVEFQSEVTGPSKEGPSISSGALADDMMSITTSEDELGSGEEKSATLLPSGMAVRLSYAFPGRRERRTAVTGTLKYLGVPHTDRQYPSPVPFFPEVHEEVTRSWKAPYSARNRASVSSILMPFQCSYVRRALLHGRVIHISHPGPVNSRLH